MEQKKYNNRFNRDFKNGPQQKKKKTLKENLGKGKNSVSFLGLRLSSSVLPFIFESLSYMHKRDGDC